MAPPVYISIFPKHNGPPFPGPIELSDHDFEPGKRFCMPVFEFAHGNGQADLDKRIVYWYDYRRKNRAPWYRSPEEALEFLFGHEGSRFFAMFRELGVYVRMDGYTHATGCMYVRHHADFHVTVPLSKAVCALYGTICDPDYMDSFLDKIELYFYRYNDLTYKTIEYFRFTFEHVKMTRVRLIMPDIKNPVFERYGPLVDLSFRYQRVTWKHLDKRAFYMDEWNHGFFQEEQKDFSKRGAAMAEAPEPAAPVTSGVELKAVAWEHTVSSVKSERNQQAVLGDTIRFSAATKNIPDGSMVLFKVYNVAGTMARTLTTIEGKVSGDKAQAEWKVEKDTKQKECELEWDAGYQGVVSGRGKVELKEIVIVNEPAEVRVDKVSIAFFFDGTGCEKDEDKKNKKDSNVAKLHELFEEDFNKQLGIFNLRAVYINGVGTDHNIFVKNAAGLIFGSGGIKKIDQALSSLKDFASDHKDVKSIPVDIFGYSRGAALARAFVNAIYGDFPGDGAAIAQWKKPPNIRVRFLGLFDTVGSFGRPGDDVNKGYVLDVNASRVERVVHFTARHEYRQTYDLVSIKRLATKHEQYKAHAYNEFMDIKPLPVNMIERSFIGSHGDVGGGAKPGEEGKRNELSRIPLYAMVDEARNAGVLFMTPEEYRDRDAYGKERYAEAYVIPPELQPLLTLRNNQALYETMTLKIDPFKDPLYSRYIHDTRDDILTGAFMDYMRKKRDTFFHGVY